MLDLDSDLLQPDKTVVPIAWIVVRVYSAEFCSVSQLQPL